MIRSVLMAATLGVGVVVSALSGAHAQNIMPCAEEGEFCRVPYPTRVFYGVRGRHVEREVDGRGIPCSNDVFGDPAPGLPKSCMYIARDIDGPERHVCAREHEFCGFRGERRVRYGAEGRFVDGIFRNGVNCDNETFGDPIPGVGKFCQILD